MTDCDCKHCAQGRIVAEARRYSIEHGGRSITRSDVRRAEKLVGHQLEMSAER